MKENVAVSRLFYPSLALCNNKRVKEIQTQRHQYSAKLCQPFQFNDENVFRKVDKNVFTDLSCVHGRMGVYGYYTPAFSTLSK